jgi:hypothetical protein
MRPACWWRHRGWRALLGGGGAALLLGCSDGYPTDDAPQIAPSVMSRTQLLQALNELGAEPHLGRRWRYGLGPGCVLEVRVHNERGRQQVPLAGASIESSSHEGRIGVRVVPERADDTEPEAVTVLETRRWTDSVRARSLLTQLEMRCSEGEPGAA